MPINLKRETFSFKKIADPAVVRRKTIVAKIGYARDKSLKLKIRSHIRKENP